MMCLGTMLMWAMACKEEPPYINYEPENVTYETTYVDVNVPTPEPREVLIEDISGVKCTNCPDATKIINNVKIQYPNRVNSITNYPLNQLDAFTTPINQPDKGYVSKFDLRTAAGANVISNYGVPSGLPSGYVNRKIFPGQAYRYIGRNEWTAKVEYEMDSVTPVNIAITPSFEGETKLNVDVKLNFTTDLIGDYYVSIALLQDSIIDVQEYTDLNTGDAAYDVNYAHRHVLRKMFTANVGDKINSSTTTLVRGRVLIKRYTLTLENEANVSPYPPFPPYDKKHLAVLAFVHRASDGVIVQSKEIEVSE